jgi:hypothetical protein
VEVHFDHLDHAHLYARRQERAATWDVSEFYKHQNLPQSVDQVRSNRAIPHPRLTSIEGDGWELATFGELLITLIASGDLGFPWSPVCHLRQHSKNSSALREMAWRQQISASARSTRLPVRRAENCPKDLRRGLGEIDG